MDILHVITTISRGGAENHLADLIRHQVDVGFVVGVAWLKGTDYWRARFENMGVKLFDLGIENYWDPRAVARLRQVMNLENPRLLHAHLPPAELCARLALLGRTSRLVISKHNDAPFYRGVGGNLLGRWVACRAERMICISQAVADSVATGRLRVGVEKVRCIRYGIDAGLYREKRDAAAFAFRQQWGCGEATVVFGCVARMVPQKDHSTLLKAFARIHARKQADIKLVLVGNGPLLEDIRTQGEALGIGDQLVFAGFHENMPAIMNAIDVLCLTSLYEGFGLVLIEAMATAKPVLATRVSSIPEIVIDGVTGRLVEKRNVNALADAMHSLLSIEVRHSLGQAGRERVLTEFNLPTMFRKTDAVYAELGVFPSSAFGN